MSKDIKRQNHSSRKNITSHNVSYAIFLSFPRINLTLYLNTSLHVHGFDTPVLPYNTI